MMKKSSPVLPCSKITSPADAYWAVMLSASCCSCWSAQVRKTRTLRKAPTLSSCRTASFIECDLGNRNSGYTWSSSDTADSALFKQDTESILLSLAPVQATTLAGMLPRVLTLSFQGPSPLLNLSSPSESANEPDILTGWVELSTRASTSSPKMQNMRQTPSICTCSLGEISSTLPSAAMASNCSLPWDLKMSCRMIKSVMRLAKSFSFSLSPNMLSRSSDPSISVCTAVAQTTVAGFSSYTSASRPSIEYRGSSASSRCSMPTTLTVPLSKT
mmetsp:Transcript_28878/g.72515  ORF Transcript_28878/g.72515 Transcript_28878/m.72515 type:complete len:273 (-) Transcript_28878:852-1670(-)